MTNLLLIENEDGSYTAFAPSLPGYHAQAANREAALSGIKAMVELEAPNAEPFSLHHVAVETPILSDEQHRVFVIERKELTPAALTWAHRILKAEGIVS